MARFRLCISISVYMCFFFLGWWGVTGNGCLCECGLFYFFIFSRLFFFIHLFIFARYWIRVAKLQNSVFLTCRHYLALCAGSRQELGVGSPHIYHWLRAVKRVFVFSRDTNGIMFGLWFVFLRVCAVLFEVFLSSFYMQTKSFI